MLVLRRKVGESIVLAGVINISVLAVEGERVKIGISAPPDVTIVREELLRTTPETETPDRAAPVQPH
jgi:carbon storage regulator